MHALGKCLFEPTEYEVPEEEQWLIDMAENGGTGFLLFLSPNGKRLKAAVHLDQYSSTMGESRPFFEFSLRGVVVQNSPK